ncbi:MAG: MEDS domain-containing protein [Candidatus Omnitrophica bacterium]|nr:MEDS domain-containing protein [Candidatus Omnitrophota bacterium]
MINYTPPTQHTSLFYNSEEEYLDIIVPYLKTGLENSEFCLWNLPETLEVKDAHEYLRPAAKDLDVYIEKGQLSIRDYRSFYLRNGVFSAQKVMESFAELEKSALGKGFNGIRATGDGSWALGKDWPDLVMYEKEINRVIDLHKIRAVCSYYIAKLQLKNICDIGANHQSSLVKQMGNWNRLDPSVFTRVSIY